MAVRIRGEPWHRSHPGLAKALLWGLVLLATWSFLRFLVDQENTKPLTLKKRIVLCMGSEEAPMNANAWCHFRGNIGAVQGREFKLVYTHQRRGETDGEIVGTFPGWDTPFPVRWSTIIPSHNPPKASGVGQAECSFKQSLICFGHVEMKDGRTYAWSAR